MTSATWSPPYTMYSDASCVRAKPCRASALPPTGPLFTAFIGFTGPQAAEKSTATVAGFGLPPSLAAVNSSAADVSATAAKTVKHIPIRSISYFSFPNNLLTASTARSQSLNAPSCPICPLFTPPP